MQQPISGAPGKLSKTPLYLKEIAHLFADPLLKDTGLEGGHLDNALKLMQDFIEKLFYAKFPEQKIKLEELNYIIKKCQYYISLLKKDKIHSTKEALQKISEDLKNLKDNYFLLIPGGWHGRTQSGHAMLYLVRSNKEFIVINTGSGSQYHGKEAKPHVIQGHFLSFILKDNQDLIKTGVLERLLHLLTNPADYYNAELLYEVILPLTAGEIKTQHERQHAYDLQLAGTCFWQCVEKLLFYFYINEKSHFKQFQQCWQKNLLAKVYEELQDEMVNPNLSVEILQTAPWETYFRLIQFAIRHYCASPLEGDQNEKQTFYFQLKGLSQLAERNLAKPHKLNFIYKSVDLQAWNIDSQFAVFDKYGSGNNISMYFPISKTDGFHLLKFCNSMDWQNRSQMMNAHFGIESFLLNLPLSEDYTTNDTSGIIITLHELVTCYYRLQSTLYPNPSPEIYAKQLIVGFSGFCFVDKIMRQHVQHYSPALSHLADKRTILDIAYDLVVASPQLAKQLQAIVIHLKKLEKLKIIFNFFDQKITIDDACTVIDAQFLKEKGNPSSFDHYRLESPLAQRVAYAIIDQEKQFFTQEIHCWREMGLLCRFLLSHFVPNENLLPLSFWDLNVVNFQGVSIKLNLWRFKKLDNICWEKYATQTVFDPAAKWLCDTPQAELKENNILVQSMPESKIINRRLFNQLAEIRISPNLQIISIIEFMIEHVHQFQHEDFHFIFEKYFFSSGQNLETEGSLFFREQHHTVLKPLLLKFMNIAEYYFGGKAQNISTYLGLVRHFIRIECFLLSSSQELICCSIYEKLYNFLNHQDKHRGEIAAHLMLLYQNAFLLPNGVTQQVVERLLICWAHLLREKQLQKNFPEFLFFEAKKVLLNLQENIDSLLNNHLLNSIFQILFARSASKTWIKIDFGCWQAEDYFINIFDGKIYYRGYQIGSLPDEITQHEDYIFLFGKSTLAIELLQANSQISVYRSLGGERARQLTLYRKNNPFEENGNQIFKKRQYGHAYYNEYILSENIHQSYFSPEHFQVELHSVQSRMAKKRNSAHQTTDIIIHEELRLGGNQFAGQFLPRWRLEGLIPCILLDKYICFIQANTDENKTIYMLDEKRECHYILDLSNQQLKLLNTQGAEWVDLVRLSKNSPLMPYRETLCLFELPNYILAFQYPDHSLIIELVRHQLKFRYNPITQLLESLNYSNYYLTIAEPIHLRNMEYQLILQNNANETIIIFPYLTNLKQAFLKDDPLNGKIYSDLTQLGWRGFFAYDYDNELDKLEAEGLESELYIVLLYAKTRDYLRCFSHLTYCWQDQVLTSKEWLAFIKFFDETVTDVHPDMHACRLHAFLLYLPIYTSMHDRQKSKDVLDENEKIQLEKYSSLFRAIIEEYGIYLSKWIYIHHKLQLTKKHEEILLCTIAHWKLPKSEIIQNREASIKRSDNAQLSIPIYPYSDILEPVFKKITLKNSYTFFSLGITPIDIFGHHQDQAVPVSDCFLFLYLMYKDKKVNGHQLQLHLRSLVWTNKLQSFHVDFILFQYLLKSSLISPHELPHLPLLPAGNKISFCIDRDDLNFTKETKMIAEWFRELKFFLEKKVVSYNLLKATDISANLSKGRSVNLDCYTSKPNTLPINPPLDNFLKMQLHFNPEFFLKKYYFNPMQPLGHLFNHYFTYQEKKPAPRSFPLEKTSGELSNYMFEYFQKDFDIFKSLPNSFYDVKDSMIIQQGLAKNLNDFLAKLVKDIAILKADLLKFANKNSSIEISYAQLAAKRSEFSLDDLLSYLFVQQREKYYEQNSFLTEEDVNKLASFAINYLILKNTLSLVQKLNVLLHNLKTSTDEKEKKNLIAQIGKLCYQKRHYIIPQKILYLFLEYLTGSLLWELQVKTLETLSPTKKDQAVQLFLGGGKSSTIAPLLGCLLADGNQFMTYTIPSALIAQFVQILRQRLRGPLFKQVHTLYLQRDTLLTPAIVKNYLEKFRHIKDSKSILVITPEVPNCMLLKWLELSKTVYSGNRDPFETVMQLENILCFLGKEGIQLIDELDFVLAPLKSELNFTEGEAKSLTSVRWEFAQQLLLAILENSILQPFIQQAIKDHHCKPHGDTQIFPQGMLELINVDFYHQILKHEIVKLILNSQQIKYPLVMSAYLLTDPGKVIDNVILLPTDLIAELCNFNHYNFSQQQELTQLNNLLTYIDKVENNSFYKIVNSKLYMRNIHPLLASLTCAHVEYLRKDDEKLLDYFILAKEWLQDILPYVFQKRLNIDYGRYFEMVVDTQLNITLKKYVPSKKLAVPYNGKDSPSKRSEYQHPDIIIAFTCLQYFYEGLHYDELVELINHLQASMEKQTSKELSARDTVVLFRQWQLDAKLSSIEELNHIDLTSPWQLNGLHQRLYRRTKIISYYLNHFVFPQYLKVFPQKNSSNGFDLSSLIFRTTKGISGTLHNQLCLPDNLMRHPQKGTDGSMLYILTMPNNQEVIISEFKSDSELLMKIDFNKFQMLIDAGGLIQNTSNNDVARILLERAPKNILGVIFVDSFSQKSQVLTRTGLVQSVAECSIPPQHLFKYIDHAHGTGTDMPQYITDRGVMTLAPHITLREVFQASKRLRLLDIYQNQSIAFLLRHSDAKQIIKSLNLSNDTYPTSQHILQWSFNHSLKQITEEFQIGTYQRLRTIVRRRAYHLLLGKLSSSKVDKELWDELREHGIIDEYNRVSREVKLTMLEDINVNNKQALAHTLNAIYRYRQKNSAMDILLLCFKAFSDYMNYDITQILPLNTWEHRSKILVYQQEMLLAEFSDILTPEDKETIKSIMDHAQQFLPEWVVTKPLNQQIECQQQQVAEKQNENQQQQQQESQKQTQQYTFFKPVDNIIWDYHELLDKNTAQLTVTVEKLKLSAGKNFRMVTIASVVSLPFAPQLLASENFLRTEIQSYTLEKWAKNIFYYLEVQEKALTQRYFILLAVKEAGFVRYCLEKNYLLNDQKSFGLRTLRGALIHSSHDFVRMDIPEILEVQLLFLNGHTENEIPSRLHVTWKEWIEKCDPTVVQKKQKALHVALGIN